MQATRHRRHVELGQPDAWLAALVVAISLALAVAGGLALTGNLPGQGEAASTNPLVVAGGASDAAVTDWWAQMRFEEENSWGADFVFPALPRVRANYYPSMGEGFTGDALAPIQSAHRALSYPRMGQGFTDGSAMSIGRRLTPLLPPYSDGLGADY